MSLRRTSTTQVAGVHRPPRGGLVALSRWCGVAAAAIGAAALAGWVTDIGWLKSIHPSMVEMKPNTALGIASLGVALTLALGGRAWARRTAIALALLASTIGLATLFEETTGSDLGIDQVLFHDGPGAVGTATPGRMATSTALCLVLLGVALTFLRLRRLIAAAQVLSVVAGAIATVELLAFLLGARGASSADPFTLMAVNTTVAFLLVSAGTLLVSAVAGGMRTALASESGGRVMRRVVPTTSIALLAGAMVVATGEHRGFYSHEVALAIFTTLAILSVTLVAWWVSSQLNQREVEQLFEHVQLSALLDSTADGILTIDERGTIRSANRKAEEMLGHERDHLAGRTIEDLVPAKFRSALFTYLGAFARGERRSSTTIELDAQREDGSSFPAEMGLARLERAGETMTSVILRDITSRKETELALKNSEERFRTLVNQIPGVAVIEVEDHEAPYGFRTVYIGAQIFDLLGWTAEEWLADPQLWINIVHPDDRAAMLEANSKADRTEDNFQIDYRAITRGGDIRWIREDSVRTGMEGEFRWHGLVTDLTDRKLLEQIVREKDAAIRANEMKDEFLSRVSHEFRTPLNAIMGFAQLLEFEDLNDLGDEAVENILRAGGRLVDLIDDVLGITNVEGSVASPEAVELEPLVRSTVELLATEADAHGIAVEVDGGASGFCATADRKSLQQALHSLISNAILYNRQGGSVHIAIVEVDEDRVRIDIRDTGEGIPEDQLRRVFDPFERLEATSGSVEGTGLGLTRCRALVEAMGGSVSVSSVEGSGSTFSVELPAANEQSKT